MITAAQDARICIWRVRPAPQHQMNVCLVSFQNLSFNFGDEVPCPVRCLHVHTSAKMKGISRGKPMKHSQIAADIYRDFKTTQVLSLKEHMVRVSEDGIYRGLSQIQEVRIKFLQEALKKDKKTGKTTVETQFENMRENQQDYNEYRASDYDETIDEEKLRAFVYLGDEFGCLKLWDLTHLMERFEIGPCQSHRETRGDQYNTLRTEMVNVKSFASQIRKLSRINMFRLPKRTDPEDSGVIVRQAMGHSKTLTHLDKNTLDGLISCGKDFKVKIWSRGLDVWGVINMRSYDQDLLWQFPAQNRRTHQQ